MTRPGWNRRLVCGLTIYVTDSGGSDMAQQILRDPYNFDFLALREPLAERELERGLLAHLRDLLLELGRGFSFVGSQVPLTVDEQTF